MQFILILIAVFTLFYSLYWLALVLIGFGSPKADFKQANSRNPNILLILPAYRPGPIFTTVLDSVKTAIRGRQNIRVYVLLQEAEKAYDLYARELGFHTENKNFGHLGGNSYQQALKYIARTIQNTFSQKSWEPEFVMLIDKDNLLAEDFFARIPLNIYDSYDIVQGRRASISATSAVAFFDSMTEALNDTMFRKAKQNLGLMIEISGSGALIETELFVDAINRLDPKAPGFDKNFMVQLLSCKRDVRAIYWPASELKEEKTSEMAAHNPQRLRWFGEQYYNALYHFGTLLRSAIQYRRAAALDYLLTLWRPPRSIQAVATPFAAIVELVWLMVVGKWPLGLPLFTLSAVILTVAVGLFLVSQNAFGNALKHGLKIPLLAWNNIFNAAKSIRKENQGKFIHTIHKF